MQKEYTVFYREIKNGSSHLVSPATIFASSKLEAKKAYAKRVGLLSITYIVAVEHPK